ncbi:hypothetical protein [Sphaerisporangium corydalis]|uniref:Uncharacterized protein n=1 Tax=Sphaerisporangium corydalis TaxID=1441875 RepID=A0ABV9EAU4_9ACTN|nr:hypothetical protein [Sphaerisporangium corydalis]
MVQDDEHRPGQRGSEREVRPDGPPTSARYPSVPATVIGFPSVPATAVGLLNDPATATALPSGPAPGRPIGRDAITNGAVWGAAGVVEGHVTVTAGGVS